MVLQNGVIAWASSDMKYAQESCKNANDYLEHEYVGRTLDRKLSTPFQNEYLP